MQGRRGHICVGGTGVNPLGTGEAGSLQTLECLSARRGGNAWERPVAAAPFPGPFFGNEQLSVTALQEVLSKQVWLNSGFLLQIQVNDTQSLQHLSVCWGAERSQRLVHRVVLVSVLPFKHLCTSKNTGLCRFQ